MRIPHYLKKVQAIMHVCLFRPKELFKNSIIEWDENGDYHIKVQEN